MTENEFITIGEIVNTHGIKGEVRVKNFSDFPEERYKVGNIIYLDKKNYPLKELTITRYRLHKNFTLLTFEGYTNINDVEQYVGSKLQAPVSDQIDLEEKEYFMSDIIGLSVFDEAKHYIGEISEIMETAANDVWVVKRNNKKDLLLPFIESVILDIDVENNEVIIHILEGLDPEDAH